MPDIHQGFQDDRQGETEVLMNFLDAIDGLSSVKQYKQRMLDAVPVQPGDRILEIGCGVGLEAQRLANLVGPQGRIVGIDKSELMISEARRRIAGTSLPIEFHVGDVHQLDFADGSFDLCRSERVLLYLEDVQCALEEMLRVVRPGGKLVLFDLDYGGVVVDAPDCELTRRIGQILTDSAPHGWIGRQLPRFFRSHGLLDVAIASHSILLSYPLFRRVTEGPLERLVGTGELTEDEVAVWLADLEEADREKHFFCAVLGFIVSGKKP
ncbi:MAG: methyltransferase domain-containing protein [Acidobacteriota bacterium]